MKDQRMGMEDGVDGPVMFLLQDLQVSSSVSSWHVVDVDEQLSLLS
jgi:hypothetical protein